MTKANHFFCLSGIPPRFYEVPASGLIYSDGVKTIVDSTGAHWFLKLIARLQEEKKVNIHYFQSWELMKRKKELFEVVVSDSLNHTLVTRQLTSIDFGYDALTFWVVNNCIILPSEFVNCHMKKTAEANTIHTSTFFTDNQH